MPIPVSLDVVAQELDTLMDQMTAYINRQTGEIATVSEDDTVLIEDEDFDVAELPDWQAEMIPRLREILSGVDWEPLPGKFDIHEWEIMREFAESVEDGKMSERLQRAIRGAGAFRMFRMTIEDYGLREAWFDFKHQALRQIAAAALEELDIPYC